MNSKTEAQQPTAESTAYEYGLERGIILAAKDGDQETVNRLTAELIAHRAIAGMSGR